MSSDIHVAAFQDACIKGDLKSNYHMLESAIIQASEKRIDIIVFPELFICGYDISIDEFKSLSLNRSLKSENDLYLQKVANLAKFHGIAIAFGYCEVDNEMNYYNSCILYDSQGTEALNYRKTHLWDPTVIHEKVIFTEGLELPIVDLFIGRLKCTIRVGILICFDCEFPEPARCLALQGAKLLLIPTALAQGPLSDVTPTIIIPARALENHVFVVYSNFLGSCDKMGEVVTGSSDIPLNYCGQSAIVGPNGKDLARHSKESTGIISAYINMDNYESEIKRNDYLNLRKSNLYANY